MAPYHPLLPNFFYKITSINTFQIRMKLQQMGTNNTILLQEKLLRRRILQLFTNHRQDAINMQVAHLTMAILLERSLP